MASKLQIVLLVLLILIIFAGIVSHSYFVGVAEGKVQPEAVLHLLRYD